MGGWWSAHLDHSENRGGESEWQISLIQEEASVFYEGLTNMELDEKREKKSSDKLHTHRLTQHFSGGDSVLIS